MVRAVRANTAVRLRGTHAPGAVRAKAGLSQEGVAGEEVPGAAGPLLPQVRLAHADQLRKVALVVEHDGERVVIPAYLDRIPPCWQAGA